MRGRPPTLRPVPWSARRDGGAVTSENIEHVAAWCERKRLPFELRLWLPNPAAPRYGVLIRDVGGTTVWSMPFPIPANPDRVAETRRALDWLNQHRPGPGAWELLLPERTVRY